MYTLNKKRTLNQAWMNPTYVSLLRFKAAKSQKVVSFTKNQKAQPTSELVSRYAKVNIGQTELRSIDTKMI